jgi:DnaJ like chaperone protein
MGTALGALIGFLAFRGDRLVGLGLGGVIGFMIQQGLGGMRRGAPAGAPPEPAGLADLFFRTTFELMGHVAKSDGRVSEAEIEAARGLMRDLNLGPADVRRAIASFQHGKVPGYDADAMALRLRSVCGGEYDLINTFVEFQLRVALAGNGLTPPARRILTRVAERLGMSGLEFARLEAALRARGRASPEDPLADSYRELEVEASASDADVTRAYRRQMSRHHPDKLVANGLPESMAQVAKEKTQRIQEAWERIRAARGMR